MTVLLFSNPGAIYYHYYFALSATAGSSAISNSLLNVWQCLYVSQDE